MDELKELAKQRFEAKRNEDAAVQARRDIDAKIATLLADPSNSECTRSEKLEGFKVSVTYGVTRKVDTKKLQTAWSSLVPALQECFNWKADLSVSKFRDLSVENVTFLSDYITATPSTPTVKVEVI